MHGMHPLCAGSGREQQAPQIHARCGQEAEGALIPQPPRTETLRKYGLSAEAWRAILARQGGVCAVCKKVPNGRLCIDHDHVRGFKKLKPELRRLHVRGLLCWFCNHTYVGRAITVEKSENVTAYLRAHVERMIQHVSAQRGAEARSA